MELNKSISKLKTGTKSNQELNDDQDQYCWLCHKDKINLSCQICPRSYHLKCINSNPTYSQLDSFTLLNDKKTFIKDDWICFECEYISKSESDEGKSECLKRITKDEFCELLSHAVVTIKKSSDVTFHTPVNLEVYNDYTDFIVHPMDFYKIEQYVKTKKYSSTEAFLSDCKWILHNCYIFNQATSPLTLNARYMLKVAKNEMYELETCPDCFRNFYKFTFKDFFIQPCSHPHNLVLAKLKGHPLWPSKVVKYNKQTKEAEVRFFGAHDKAWISLENCFLLNEIPSPSRVNKNQRGKLEIAIKELEAHLNLLNEKFPNLFQFSPPKTNLEADQVYLIPLPEHVTTTSQPSISYSSSSVKDTSSANESLNSENVENVTQPHKKQKKTATTAVTPKTNKQVTKEPALDETDLNDSDDDNEHKLVIDDNSLINSTNKKRPSSRRSDSISSTSTKASSTVIKPNSSVQKRKLSAVEQSNVQKNESSSLLLKDETTAPVSTKKKMKKNFNDSISSNSSSNYIVTNYQSQQTSTISKEKVDQLVEQVQYLKAELERSRSLHIQEIKEMFENHKSEFRDLKLSLDAEKAKALASLRRELESKHNKHIEEIKRKSWCTYCLKQASYFCCRLASYCSYDCQSEHWINHMTTCLQNKETATMAITATASEPKLSSPAQQDTEIEKELIDETNTENKDDKEEKQKNSSIIEKVNQKTNEKGPIKKIKQIIEEKNEQVKKGEESKNEQVKKGLKSKNEEQSKNKEVIKDEKSTANELSVESSKMDNLKSTSTEIKKPIVEKQTIEQSLNKIKHPEKPKDRFLKKLNENKSSLIESKNPLPVKNEEIKSKPKIASDNLKKIDLPLDKSVESIKDKESVEHISSKEADKIEPQQKKSKVEENLNTRNDELEQMRQNLMKKLLEKQQQIKTKNLKDNLNEDKKTQKSGECLKADSNKEPKSKLTEKPVEKVSVEKVNLSEESDESMIESKVESKVDLKVNLKDNLKDAVQDKSKNDVQSELNKEDELVNDEEFLNSSIEDDNRLMVELINKGLKQTEKEEQLNAKAETLSKDQLVNQEQNNEEVSLSSDNQSTIHSDVNQVKEDLISKVVNELNN